MRRRVLGTTSVLAAAVLGAACATGASGAAGAAELQEPEEPPTPAGRGRRAARAPLLRPRTPCPAATATSW